MTAKRTFVGALSISALIWSLWLPSALPAGRAQDEEVKKLYALNCAVCHASDGSGDTDGRKQHKADALRSKKVQQRSDQELYDLTATRKKKMPGFEKKLGKNQVRQLIASLPTLAQSQ